ncbi:hypothetical protein EKO04_001546 [Ascochyta lentis]|uniref:DNA 3'-5' helicase n=1 Tax=Ascochyta lentis TaxID=205686 RepID=A0A8H7JA67_9PLEO|nr:hypothetical protein EKO04_001546 [Ascochyta lentis]
MSQQRSSRPEYNVLQPQLVQAPIPVAQRERYRVSQHDHPMYDVVEDDDDGYDSFDECMLQQPHDDRQHQAVQGRARLSLAPASSRLFGHGVVEKERLQPRTQQMHQELYDDRDGQLYPETAVRGSLSRAEYNANQHIKSSSDDPFGALSSPALDASRRRAGQHELNSSHQASQPRPFEATPLQSMTNLREDGGPSYGNEECCSGPPRRNIGYPFQQVISTQSKPTLFNLAHTPPTVQGIPLVPISALPDRLRTVFPFPTFNAVQSKCFDQVFKSNDNFVLASPTGSGKTAILELAVCRAVATNTTGQYKVVYQAPTKALCSERQRDWDKKFTQIGLKCAELTGDSDASDLRNVQSANIIITTPEKWDSMTRKWKDHEKLMKLIKLVLIDEVHILKEDRGAVLEVVVSRMKSIGTDVRFVALSATVPNFHDVASWLGKNSAEPHIPASKEKFGEEFRPVKLRRHVCGYVCHNNNDFAFEKQLDARLPEVILKFSERKPMMVFCATRNSTVNTAKLIANWWGSRGDCDRLWNSPAQAPRLQNKALRELVASGVAFHHAGLDFDDRMEVEKGFLQGDISVVCCTSTLAVGVNLPCHLVIIKNTMSWTQNGMQEYSDLEMMQMLGRAGRPQFDDSAVAVIMTRQTKVRRYETLATGEEVLESKLHLNLIDHMNAEIVLGTIRDLDSARKWLTGTFLYVRLQQNPVYYKLEGSRSGQGIQEQVDDICFRDIALLREHHLATGEQHFRCTEYGHAMARYYVHFETMKVFMGLQPKSTLSEILSAIAQASEFSKIRFRQGEKSLYKTLNKSPSIRFPIPVNLDLPAQKVSLIIQSVLGATDISWDGEVGKHKQQYLQDLAMIFKSTSSLIRCIIDCQICSGDSVSIHSALMLERCLGSKAWDDSPLQMIQVPTIGVVSVRKLVNAGIRSIEDLEATDARRIDTIVGRNPPFGLTILDALKSFPKLRVSLHIQPASVTKTPEGVKIQVKADIGFINEKPPDRFAHKLIYVCLLAETSDGRKVHFARINGPKLGVGQSLVFPALLTGPDQKINCYLMCEGIAGSMRGATVTPKIAPSMFPLKAAKPLEPAPTHQPNMSRRRIENVPIQREKSAASDDFGDPDIDDDTLAQALCGDLDFEHIDNFANPTDVITRNNTTKNKSAKQQGRAKVSTAEDADGAAPVQLSNGRWACSHKCKDREACKHYCCKHGMDKPPKKAAPKRVSTDEHHDQPPSKGSMQPKPKMQTKLQLQTSKRKSSTVIEELDLTQQEKKQKNEYPISGPRNYGDLHKLHKSVQKKDMPSSLHSVMHKKPAYCYGEGGEHQLSFLSQSNMTDSKLSSEYGDLGIDEFARDVQTQPTYSDNMTSFHFSDTSPVASRRSETFGDDDSVFGEAIVGLIDSQDLQESYAVNASSKKDHNVPSAIDVAEIIEDVGFPLNIDFALAEDVSPDAPKQTTSVVPITQVKVSKPRPPVFHSTSSPVGHTEDTRPTESALPDRELGDVQQGKDMAQYTDLSSKDEMNEGDIMSDLFNLIENPTALEAEDLTRRKQVSIKDQIPTLSVELNAEEEPQQVPDAFKDLHSWLFREFGDIVELVDE